MSNRGIGLGTERFGIGQPVRRTEDPVLLRGEGRYTDDLSLPGQAYAVMVRSPHAHGRIRRIDRTAATAMPGVLLILTGSDLAAAGYGGLTVMSVITGADGQPIRQPPRLSLQPEVVRFVGDAVACVVAETLAQARDAAEALVVEIDPLPAVTDPEAALAPGAPQLHAEAPGNLAVTFRYGDQDAVAAAFARAAHKVSLRLVNNRVVVAAMEPRAALGSFEDGRFVLRVGCQGVWGLRANLARDVLKVPPEQVRILTGHVGGSFGMKAAPYPEYAPVLHAAKLLGRPVKWTDDRSGAFLSDSGGRGHVVEAALALDADGMFLAVSLNSVGDLGAYLAQFGPIPATANAVKNIQSVYRTPLIAVTTRLAFTNTTPIGPYRGAGRPEGNYYMERLIDTAASLSGIDRVELRRRNLIAPTELPRRMASGMDYDSGDFPAILTHALALADWDGFEARRRDSATRGRLRGRGIGCFLEVTAPPAAEMGGISFDADGGVTIRTGTLDYGQGHQAPFAQVLVDRLGLPFERIRLIQGDSDELIAGGGTGGSKSMMASGAALVEAAEQVVTRGRRLAADVLEAAEADIEFGQGRFQVVGTDRGIDLLELAATARARGTSLDVAHIHTASPSAFPNGCHIAEVEVDPDTGVVQVVAYSAVNDFGTVVNPLLVEGQAHGGIVQGIGQALFEQVVFDEAGQPLTGSFMDYAVPRADAAPWFRFALHSVPATTNPLGVKGCGEAGCAGALPSVMNAVVDALRPLGIHHIDMPATPQRVWQALATKLSSAA
ncbi:MAG: xanthine dehydrogenase family protein molybdopterin-binding subunit [Alphaproteobacteria bacterium]|nr:xanthine dehydrogenase family protein molybdopterin-binding subunit [Alphaproteobacteria bacterium]